MTQKTPIIFKKAIKWVFISVLVVSGIPWITFGAFTYLRYLRMQDPAYDIVAIVQANHDSEPLKTGFLAELLGLSIDQPHNLYRFDIEEGQKKLLSFPSIKSAVIKKIPPGILFIEYALRKPQAFLGDVSNTVVDLEQYAFPAHPFFSPKKLPVFFIGATDEDIVFGKPVSDSKLKLAYEILETINQLGLGENDWIKIDVSHVDAMSLGQRKIVVSFLNLDVLLDPRGFKEGLIRYKALMNKQDLIQNHVTSMVDLRLPNLGYIVIPNKAGEPL